jgi:hypothetical protein
MKNFSDLLATNPHLNVILKLKRHGEAFWYGDINEKAIQTYTSYRGFKLHEPITIRLKLTTLKGQGGLEIESLKIDNIDILKYVNKTFLSTEGEDWELKIDKPFYHWYHEVSGQGWLLTPAPISG